MSSNLSLLEVQRALRRAIVDGDTEPLQAVLANDAMAIADAVGIYRNTIRWTLTRALRLSYPAVHKLVGTEFFEGVAEQFSLRHWPQSACLDDFGADFGQFLDTFGPARGLTYLPDVARLEWAVHQALHAPRARELSLERLLQLKNDQRPAVRFSAHPSLRLVAVDTPADTIWRAILEQDESALVGIEVTRAPRYLLVQRDPNGGAEVLALAQGEWKFLQALSFGVALEPALQEFHDTSPGADLDHVLARHLAAGRFTDFSLGMDCGDFAVLRTLN